MGDRRCCCAAGCDLGEDDFDDREDGEVPSNDPKWKVLSGEWEFDSGIVRDVTPGILATRICHPAAYPLGSFVATFTLKELDTNPTYKIRCGNPVTSDYEVWFEAADFGGAGPTGTLTITVYGDGGESRSEEIELDSTLTELDAKVCYAPGLHLLGQIDLQPNRYPVLCIDGTADADNCYTSAGLPDGYDIGNFAFLEGHFDDWDYDVHWIENHDCPSCDCFCFTTGDDWSCLDIELTLNITSDPAIWDCPGAEQSVTMYRMDHPTRPAATDPFYGFYGGGSTNPKSWVWVSDPISCNSGIPPFADVRAILLCGTPITEAKLVLVRDDPSYSSLPSSRLMWLGASNSSNLDQQADESSVCSPLSIIFTDVALASYQCQDPEDPCEDEHPFQCSQFACCGPCYGPGEGPTERFLEIEITE